MRTYTVDGYYGSGRTPCLVYVAENSDGSRWYAVDGGLGVNCTFDEIGDGVNVEELRDVDFFTPGREIDSEETLAEEIES